MESHNRDQIENARKGLAKGIKERLAQPAIDVLDARDGLRDCFVSSYLGGVSQGLAHFDIQGNPDAVSRVVENMFKKRLRATGSSWSNPTPEALQTVKDALDTETHMDELPAELKGVHDQVCTLLIGKARGDLSHVGDASAIPATRSAESSVSPATDSSTPAQVAVDAQPNPVLVALRSAVTAQLRQMVELSEGASSFGQLRELLAEQSQKLQQLLKTADSFSAEEP